VHLVRVSVSVRVGVKVGVRVGVRARVGVGVGVRVRVSTRMDRARRVWRSATARPREPRGVVRAGRCH